jgi:N-succinyldiaminopimelate aminotransferase
MEKSFWNSLDIPPSVRLNHMLSRVSEPEKDIIDFSGTDPVHNPPPFVIEEFKKYASTIGKMTGGFGGMKSLRGTISDWARRRYALKSKSFNENNVVATNGEEEAIFLTIQILAEGSKDGIIVLPNPADPIYETAGAIAGLTPFRVSTMTSQQPSYRDIPEELLEKIKVVVVNSPADPYGGELPVLQWEWLLKQSQEYGFFILSDERFNEIYRGKPSPGLLEMADSNDNPEFSRCVVVNGLTMRSNLVGMRSAWVGGDKEFIKKANIYRHYHGLYLPIPNQRAAIMAYSDEGHVEENRKKYAGKFKDAPKRCSSTLPVSDPLHGPFLWLRAPGDDIAFAITAYGRTGVKVMPGQLLAKKHGNVNPAIGMIRIALVHNPGKCAAGLLELCKMINPKHRSQTIMKS